MITLFRVKNLTLDEVDLDSFSESYFKLMKKLEVLTIIKKDIELEVWTDIMRDISKIPSQAFTRFNFNTEMFTYIQLRQLACALQ